MVKGLLIPEGSTVLEAAGPTPSDFDHLPLLIVNGDYRASSNRQTNYDAVAAINASPTRAVSSAAVMDLDAPEFAASSTAPPT